MRPEIAEKLCCPMDKADLDMRVYAKHEDGEILEALFTCEVCGRYYPVIYGIPIMTPDEYRDKSLEAPVLRRWGFELDESRPGKFLLEE